MKNLLMAFILVLPMIGVAETIYKYRGPGGRIIYTDVPPAKSYPKKKINISPSPKGNEAKKAQNSKDNNYNEKIKQLNRQYTRVMQRKTSCINKLVKKAQNKTCDQGSRSVSFQQCLLDKEKNIVKTKIEARQNCERKNIDRIRREKKILEEKIRSAYR